MGKAEDDDLTAAVASMRPDLVSHALARGADPNAKIGDVPAVQIAALSGPVTNVDLLIRAGADVNARGNCADTALHLACAGGGADLMPLMRFLGAFLFMCFLVRLGGLVRRRRDGRGVHSRYTGYPRLMRLIPRADERRVKGALEPLLVFFVGIFASPTSEPLGGYLILTSVGLAVSVQLSIGYERQRVIDMNDAYLEQRYVAERFREMRRN